MLWYLVQRGSGIQLLSFSPTVSHVEDEIVMEDGNGHMWPHYYIRGETTTTLPGRRHCHYTDSCGACQEGRYHKTHAIPKGVGRPIDELNVRLVVWLIKPQLVYIHALILFRLAPLITKGNNGSWAADVRHCHTESHRRMHRRDDFEPTPLFTSSPSARLSCATFLLSVVPLNVRRTNRDLA
jgi:hypothetical protein